MCDIEKWACKRESLLHYFTELLLRVGREEGEGGRREEACKSPLPIAVMTRKQSFDVESSIFASKSLHFNKRVPRAKPVERIPPSAFPSSLSFLFPLMKYFREVSICWVSMHPIWTLSAYCVSASMGEYQTHRQGGFTWFTPASFWLTGYKMHSN